uniref:Uncharacterized protein n=1 Tax=Cyprinus carpio TaxID=7962 RepID=A0A8C1LQA7_CYPCA
MSTETLTSSLHRYISLMGGNGDISHREGRNEVASRPGRSGARCRNSIASCADEQPHIGNYRLLKTIGKGNFAKVKLARHILTGREVSFMKISIENFWFLHSFD